LFLLLGACTSAYGQGYRIYVGTYTNGTSKGIYTCRFDTAEGQFTSPELAAPAVNPSFLAIEPTGRYLYSVNEVDTFQGKPAGAVSAFSIDRSTGILSLLQQVSSMGGSPAYISIDRSSRFVMVANYTGGSVTVFPVGSDGRLGHSSSFVQHRGSGPNRERQSAPHAHFIQTTTDNRSALAADLGADKIFIYALDPLKGLLRPAEQASLSMTPGSGPRHVGFSPNGRVAYVLNELASTVTLLRLGADSRMFEKDRSVSTLPQNFSGTNTAAEVATDAAGTYLYASNRGNNSIVRFTINAKDGTLSDPQWTQSGGSAPRYFCLDPTGNWLLAANQNSDNITVFRIDRSNGRFGATPQVLKVPSPVCIVFAGKE
jgi:6-phosphogluconolactonase